MFALFTILGILSSTSLTGGQIQIAKCPLGYTEYGTSCYLFPTLRANWIQAMKLCELYGAELATVETEEEQLWLENYLKARWTNKNQTYGIWLGGTDILVENEWIWAKTGKQIEYTRWAPDEPSHVYQKSNADEGCLNIFPEKNFMWNDARCEDEFDFICEKSTLNGNPGIVIG